MLTMRTRRFRLSENPFCLPRIQGEGGEPPWLLKVYQFRRFLVFSDFDWGDRAKQELAIQHSGVSTGYRNEAAK